MELIWIKTLLCGLRQESAKRQGQVMLDAILIVAAIGFFVLACGYAVLCERM
jgi:hypothetical protein